MNDQQPSGLYQSAARLGTALGLAAAIFLAPLLYGWGKAAVGHYLIVSFGRDIAPWMLWATGAIEAYVVFIIAKGLITFALSWLMTALAARGLGNY